MKNLKLLLATTAILSMGAMAANAKETGISGDAAVLQASVKFLEPVTLTQSQAIHFGTLLHPHAGDTVLWRPNSSTSVISSDSSATLAYTTGTQAPKIGIMTYSGPSLTNGNFMISFSSTSNGTQDDSATISLTNGSGQSAKTCGSVEFLRQLTKIGTNSYSASSLSNDDQIYIGGTFTVDANYDNTISYGECTGSVYVTLIIHE